MNIAAAITVLSVFPVLGADITQVYAMAGGSADGQPVSQTCEKSGYGEFLECGVSAGDGIQTGFASASARAHPGYVSIFAGATGNGNLGGADASGLARNQSYYVIPGSGIVDLTGIYIRSCVLCDSGGQIEIVQNGTAPLSYPYFIPVTSTVRRGMPFEVVLQVSADISAGGIIQGINRSEEVQFRGFFDNKGKAVPYSLVRNPAQFCHSARLSLA